MHASPDPTALRAFLTRLWRRLALRAALGSAAVTLAAATVIVVVTPGLRSPLRASLVAVTAVAVGALIGIVLSRRARRDTMRDVDARASLHNLLVTAMELIDGAVQAPPHVAARVVDDAMARTARLDLAQVLPLQRAAWLFAAAAIASVSAIALAGRIGTSARAAGDTAPFTGDPAITHVEVLVTPPAYAQRPAQTLTNPSRIEALSGSQLTLTVTGAAESVTLATADASRGVFSDGSGRFTFETSLTDDGFLALTPHASDGRTGPRQLIGLVAAADALPRVRILQPDRDLVLSDGKRRLDVAVEADDDLGLASLDVRYTKVTGSGENFTFAEGDLPVAVTQTSGVAWQGRATLDLAALSLEPGDMVIYRARARDRRPSAPFAESETLIVEIAAPGALASDGFAIDDREDRYAISQQMVILKTERLLAERGKLPPEEVTDRSRMLAAEQRRVRAEFVFMMGGELADAGIDISTLNEHEEAERETDLAAGYLVNQGRADLIRAIRAMSRAAVLLNEAAEIDAALTEEKSALNYLQRAFTRARYLLRTLTTRERLDLSRRLTGDLAALAPLRLPASEPTVPPRAEALREVLSSLAALPGDADAAVIAATLTDGAERLLKLDPSSATLRDTATSLATAAAAARDRGDVREARAALERAVLELAAVLRADTPAAPARTPSLDERRLRGALADAARSGGAPR